MLNAPDSVLSEVKVRSLSLRLREETGALHLEVEELLGLPDRITSLGSYGLCLMRFYRFYRPLEACLASLEGRAEVGLNLKERAQAGKLRADLEAMGLAPGEQADAPATSLPRLKTGAQAAGALYVLEGSTLGGQFILPRIAVRLGEQIAGADTFFRSHGAQTMPRWQQFRGALDAYGAAQPGSVPEVISGAKATFRAIGIWMQP